MRAGEQLETQVLKKLGNFKKNLEMLVIQGEC